MSRIGKNPIPVPGGVDVTVADRTVNVKGPRASCQRDLPGVITVRQEATARRRASRRRAQNRAQHGLTRTLVANMVTGRHRRLHQGARDRTASATAPTPRARATSSSPSASSHPVRVEAPDGIEFEVIAATGGQASRIVRGIDKEQVGQVAADIRKIRKPEPYKGKGVRYAGEHIQRKAGKTGK